MKTVHGLLLQELFQFRGYALPTGLEIFPRVSWSFWKRFQSFVRKSQFSFVAVWQQFKGH